MVVYSWLFENEWNDAIQVIVRERIELHNKTMRLETSAKKNMSQTGVWTACMDNSTLCMTWLDVLSLSLPFPLFFFLKHHNPRFMTDISMPIPFIHNSFHSLRFKQKKTYRNFLKIFHFFLPSICILVFVFFFFFSHWFERFQWAA